MRINCHGHIFNFRSQNTSQTRQTLVNRLTNENWPDFLVKAVAKVFDELLKDDNVDEEQLLRSLLKQLKVSDEFKDFLDSAFGALPGDIGIIIHGNLDALEVEVLRNLIRKLSDRLSSNDDVRNQNIEDILGFILIGMQPTIADVADNYMQRADPEDAMVALMMDITKGGDGDDKKFKQQIDDTAETALTYPGRILPFFAVNGNRTGHFQLLKEAVETKGYVGVKIYPSLGYAPDSAAMKKVYGYCVANELPVLMHCNQGGFFFTKADIDFANPNRWEQILQEYPDLKICFGHFGGDHELSSQPDINQLADWTGTILELMRNHEGVYADVSYHTEPMNGGPGETIYFTNLKALLAAAPYKDRILFGSDYHLVRLRIREENYWEYFRHNLGDDLFDRISITNARRFLGFPQTPAEPARANLIRHVNFLKEWKLEVKSFPAPWVSQELLRLTGEAVAFVPNPFGAAFTPRNPAHYYTAWFLAKLYTPKQRKDLGLTFEKIGQTQIRDLPGWPLETEDAANREQTWLSFAKEMHMTMAKPAAEGGPGATPEDGFTATKAVNQLKAQFKRGSDQAYKFGRLVDTIYHFPNEIMSLK